MPRPSAPATDSVAGADFDALYHACRPDVIAMVYTLTGNLGEAQDIAQEAFTRAWQRWSKIAHYDNPEAWIRRVAANLATSRWRRLRVATSFLQRQRVESVPELSPDRVALLTALRTLSPDQRRAIVLHHMLDLPVADVAHELDVPVGTVKSWLSRGRAALAAQLTPAADRV